jgi:hypothetical protein
MKVKNGPHQYELPLYVHTYIHVYSAAHSKVLISALHTAKGTINSENNCIKSAVLSLLPSREATFANFMEISLWIVWYAYEKGSAF